MTAFELQWRVLLSVSDDYESFEHIKRFVENEASEAIASADLEKALDALLRQHLVNSFFYDDLTYTYERAGDQPISEKMWFYISTEGVRVIDIIRAGTNETAKGSCEGAVTAATAKGSSL